MQLLQRAKGKEISTVLVKDTYNFSKAFLLFFLGYIPANGVSPGLLWGQYSFMLRQAQHDGNTEPVEV